MKISEKQYSKMPKDIQAMFRQLPNPGRDEVLALMPETSSGARSLVGHEKPQGVTGFGGSDNREYSGDRLRRPVLLL